VHQFVFWVVLSYFTVSLTITLSSLIDRKEFMFSRDNIVESNPADYRTPFDLTLTEVCIQIETTFDNGSLGSRNDEERSEMRYVM